MMFNLRVFVVWKFDRMALEAHKVAFFASLNGMKESVNTFVINQTAMFLAIVQAHCVVTFM